MKILVLTHSPAPYQVEFFDAVNRLSGVSLRVVYLFAADPNRSWGWREPKHDYIVIAGQQPNLPDLWEKDADLLVVNYYRHQVAANVMKRLSKNKKPWVFWGEKPGFKHPLWGRIARLWWLRTLHCSKAPIWGVGKFAIQGYKQEFGSKRHYVNLPYFSDLQRFSGLREKKQDVAERVILFSGSLIPRKGVDLLAKAFAAVGPHCPWLRLHLVGGGELEDELRAILAPVAGQVRFIGFKDWHELPAVYASADVLAVPSRYDGWGLVIPEGLAAGLPVIATNRMGAALDLLQDGKNGWLIEADNLPGLQVALEKAAALGNDELVGMSAAASCSVEDHSLDHGAKRFAAACRSAIENRTL